MRIECQFGVGRRTQTSHLAMPGPEGGRDGRKWRREGVARRQGWFIIISACSRPEPASQPVPLEWRLMMNAEVRSGVSPERARPATRSNKH